MELVGPSSTVSEPAALGELSPWLGSAGGNAMPSKTQQCLIIGNHPTPSLTHGTSTGQMTPSPGPCVQLVEGVMSTWPITTTIQIEMVTSICTGTKIQSIRRRRTLTLFAAPRFRELIEGVDQFTLLLGGAFSAPSRSLVPRPHPASRDSSLVTIEGFLGSADSALTDKRAH